MFLIIAPIFISAQNQDKPIKKDDNKQEIQLNKSEKPEIIEKTDKTQTNFEIIHISKLAPRKSEFILKRDIFSPDTMTPIRQDENLKPVIPPKQEEPEENPDGREEIPVRNIVTETQQRIQYEGYVIKESKRSALVTIGGETLIVGVNDIIKDNVKIIEIEKKFITVEVESTTVQIQLKGENNND